MRGGRAFQAAGLAYKEISRCKGVWWVQRADELQKSRDR